MASYFHTLVEIYDSMVTVDFFDSMVTVQAFEH